MTKQYNDFQQKYHAWLFWFKQSSTYRANNPEPPKPEGD